MERWAVFAHDGQTSRWKWVVGGTVMFVAGAGLGLFLVREGLDRASAWVTVLGFPLVVAGTAAGVWSVVRAAGTGREGRRVDTPLRQESQDLSGQSTPERPGMDASGSIRQSNTGGINAAHTGQGDINLTGTDK
jgi:hypothetical protein